MRVVNSKQVCFVRWVYENPDLLRLIDKVNQARESVGLSELTYEELKEEKYKDICDILGVHYLPTPRITTCEIADDTTKLTIVSGTIKRHFRTPHSLDEARKKSMERAILQLYPMVEPGTADYDYNKKERRAFWKAYMGMSTKRVNSRTEKRAKPKAAVAAIEPEKELAVA